MDWNDPDDLRSLVQRLRRLPSENEWVEFKVDNADPGSTGEYVSCLANSAALAGQETGYLIWGVSDATHEIVGTTFRPETAKKGNEDLYHWILRLLTPQSDFSFHSVEVDGKTVVVLRVAAAAKVPVKFQNIEYIRVGSYKKNLSQYPDHQRRLWKVLEASSFEDGTAAGDLGVEQVVQLLDYPEYFRLHKTPLPESRSGIIETLEADRLIRHTVEDQWQITNGGALLYAKDLGDFPKLARKAPRVIHYEGKSRIRTKKEQIGQRGYAAGFQGLIAYIADQLPNSEVIQDGLRMDELQFPRLAIRELVANALIHQDLTVTGAGPMIEIFDDRLEITNPGLPLLDPLRFIDLAPRSRNEFIGAAMRQVGIAEERGSGWDKIAAEIEFHQLPPARVEDKDEQTRVTLFAPKPLTKMDRPDRVLAVYQHACLRYVSNEPTNNASVRERFGIPERNKALASRIIKEAVDEDLIVVYDPSAGPRSIRYVPYWADPER
ncbi:ATP-binding protein [Micropruina sp.]|uniref:ATP-binding protein n=1 Tax=Micropruina sp. TaxID=2737536 RepID=UPI0039E2322A